MRCTINDRILKINACGLSLKMLFYGSGRLHVRPDRLGTALTFQCFSPEPDTEWGFGQVTILDNPEEFNIVIISLVQTDCFRGR